MQLPYRGYTTSVGGLAKKLGVKRVDVEVFKSVYAEDVSGGIVLLGDTTQNLIKRMGHT